MMKKEYLKERTQDYIDEGHPQNVAHNKARQSWRPKVGSFFERLIKYMLLEYCKNKGIKITSDKKLKKKNLPKELDLVRRMLEIHFNDYSILPDTDLVLYKYDEKEDKVRVLAILSLKTSFRERFTETPYWKLKLKENPTTEKIKVLMITPDNTNEISYNNDDRGPRKARIIMEYELDGIYLAKEDFDESEKVRPLNELFENIQENLENGLE